MYLLSNYIQYIKKTNSCLNTFFLGNYILRQFLTLKNNNFYLIQKENLIKVSFFFRNSFLNNQKNLIEIIVIDNGCKKKRFLLIFILGNNEKASLTKICLFADDNEPIKSLYKLFSASEWLEREAWDLMGINFCSKNKKRILSDYNFIGHSLRKNFPKSGFYESKKREGTKIKIKIRTKSLQQKFKKTNF